MDEDDKFDEFGNPIGEVSMSSDSETSINNKQVSDSDDESDMFADDSEHDEEEQTSQSVAQTDTIPASDTKDLVLHEDNFSDEDVEVLVETMNTQSINEPLVKPAESRSKGEEYTMFSHVRKNIPKTSFDRKYMLDLLSIPERIRNVAVIGPLHSGKTSLVDMMVYDAHKKLPYMTKNIEQGWRPLRFMDSFRQEVERGVSIKLNGLTFMATDLNDKSMVYNILDAPGHVNFMDETAVALEAADVAIICVDIVEGVTNIVRKLISLCEQRNISIVFVLNKLDRLILEMKLPPIDTCLKIKHIIADINKYTKEHFSPELDNVVFASTKLGFSFTLREFVSYYYSKKIPNDKIDQFISKSFGDITYSKGRFHNITDSASQRSTFHDFFIQPIYKIFGMCVTLDNNSLDALTNTLKLNFNIKLPNPHDLIKLDPQPLLRYICKLIFHSEQTGLYHNINRSEKKIANEIKSNPEQLLARALKTLDYGGEEYTLVQIYSGSMEVGKTVSIIDSSVPLEAEYMEQEQKSNTISRIALMGGRYVYDIEKASEGQLVLVKGISHLFEKSAIIYSNMPISEIPNFGPIDYINHACFRIIIEPLIPKELPKLLDAFVKVTKYYPGLITKIEESGEHVMLGFGELYMDCLLYDLRKTYAMIEIKTSSPVTIFSESVAKDSFTAIPVESTDGNISLSVSASPLDRHFLRDLSQNKIIESDIEKQVSSGSIRQLSKMLRTDYGWDSLTARNVWSFHNSNTFVDDTLVDETDKDVLQQYKEQIIQGFYWAVREGPLCEERLYGVQFNLLSFSITNLEEAKNIGSQLIPMVRKACYIAIMTAEPILLEPVFEVNTLAKSVLLPIAEELFRKRRGARIHNVRKIGGSPFTEITGQVPVIESIGFETDLRLSTEGNAMCQLYFWDSNWRRVSGDVLDEDAVIPKLTPAPHDSLSRDFVMKTRRRKGISNTGFMSNDGPSLAKYISAELFQQLKQNNLV
ncbi:U5 snRNP GTPase [Maudiozyma humilis]|uniref:U5 snRNP GTPase n=1 Tax=Maudiozyma humilis TaxID=51915 RepID=A0AAV5RUT7_MAUHU|nr:U5 snRNP GTPase [Kazachstania humilis]